VTRRRGSSVVGGSGSSGAEPVQGAVVCPPALSESQQRQALRRVRARHRHEPRAVTRPQRARCRAAARARRGTPSSRGGVTVHNCSGKNVCYNSAFAAAVFTVIAPTVIIGTGAGTGT
jgi:hypothetical protein